MTEFWREYVIIFYCCFCIAIIFYIWRNPGTSFGTSFFCSSDNDSPYFIEYEKEFLQRYRDRDIDQRFLTQELKQYILKKKLIEQNITNFMEEIL